MAQKIKYSNSFVNCDLTAENAIAYRRLVGLEPKDRVAVTVMIERELLEAANVRPRSGDLSDKVNMGLNLILVQTGQL